MSPPSSCPYETLGVERAASSAEIKAAYRKLVLEHHPDKYVNATENQKARATAKFQQVQDAFETVGDRAGRARHDARGHARRGQYPGASTPSSPYTYRSGWHQFSRGRGVKGAFSRVSSARVSVHEVFAMVGVASLVLFGTAAMDDALTFAWNANNSGKLYRDLAAPERNEAKTAARTKKKRAASQQ